MEIVWPTFCFPVSFAEKALPDTWRSDFRKSVALVDEPDVSFAHYCRFATSIVDGCDKPTGGNGGAKLVHGSGGIVSLRAEQNSAT